MNIVHICLGCFYVDNMEYQENVLPRKHKELGHNVSIISSTYAFDETGKPYKRKVGNYLNSDGIMVYIMARKKGLPFVIRRLKYFDGLYETLEKLDPDIIFIHGAQFFDIKQVVKYKKRNMGVTVYCDQHADYVNTPIKPLKYWILNRVIWRKCPRKIEKYCKKFWGVTPLRVRYLQDVYGIKPDKTDLLVMGGDEKNIIGKDIKELRAKICEQNNIPIDSFLIVTGGKINEKKKIHWLIDALNIIKRENVFLIVFGSCTDEMKERILDKNNHNVRYVGWIDSIKAYDYFLAADLGVFPGTHSVLWEQAVACGLPCIFKHWDGMEHVNKSENAILIDDISVNSLKDTVLSLLDNAEAYRNIKSNAEKVAKDFYYIDIAKRAIEMSD